MKALALAVISHAPFEILLAVCGTVAFLFLKAICIGKNIPELAASKLDNLERKMMTDTVNVVGYLLWICMYLVSRLRLRRVRTGKLYRRRLVKYASEASHYSPTLYVHQGCAVCIAPCTTR